MSKKKIFSFSFIITSLFLTVATLSAQSTDSLVKVLHALPESKKNNPEDTTYCSLLSRIMSDCDESQLDYYAQQLKSVSERNLAQLSPDDSLARSYKAFKAVSLCNIGMAYLDKGDIVKSFDYLFQSLKLLEAIGRTYQAGLVCNDIGDVYFFIGDRSKAVEYFSKAYSILKNIAVPEDLTPILNNMAFIYMDENKLDKAFKAYEDCCELARKTGDKEMEALNILGIGNIYAKQGKWEKALENYQVSLAMNEKLGRDRGLAAVYNGLGNLYRVRGDYATARDYMEKALKLRIEVGGFFGIREAASALEDIYEHLKNYPKALEMEKLHTRMVDSVNNEGVRKAALRKQLEYEFDKKTLIMKDEREKLITLYEQKRRFYIVLGIVLFVLVIIAFLTIYFRYRFKKEEESKNLHIELKDQLKVEIAEKERIANSLLHIQEKEREKLAAELHDGVNQLLFAAKIQLQAAKSVEESMHREAVNLVDSAISEIRSIAANEGSFLLKNRSIKEALQDLILQMKGNQDIRISFLNYGFDEERLTGDQKTTILRIIQELLNNAIKHSGAHEIFISVKSDNKMVMFAVTDTGRGLQRETMIAGNGLKNISNKVALMKGRQRTFSMRGRGTKSFALIPLS